MNGGEGFKNSLFFVDFISYILQVNAFLLQRYYLGLILFNLDQKPNITVDSYFKSYL